MTLIGAASEPLSKRIARAMERHAQLSEENEPARLAKMAASSRAYRAGLPSRAERYDKDRLGRQAAEEFGLSQSTYSKGGTVVRWVFNHPDDADVLEILDTRGIEPAFRAIQSRERRRSQKRSASAAVVNAAVPQAIASLEGIVMGLAGLPLDLADDPGREEWAAALRRSARELHRFAKEVTT